MPSWGSSAVGAQSIDAQQKALELITNTADRICNVVSTRGEASSAEAQGNIKAQLSGLASKLAEAGVAGSGKVTSERYQNVLRQDLSATMRDSAKCKLDVFNSLRSLVSNDSRSDGGGGQTTTVTSPGGVAIGRDNVGSPIQIGK